MVFIPSVDSHTYSYFFLFDLYVYLMLRDHSTPSTESGYITQWFTLTTGRVLVKAYLSSQSYAISVFWIALEV